MINFTRFFSARSSHSFPIIIEFFSVIPIDAAAFSESRPRVALSFNDSTAPSVQGYGWRPDFRPGVLPNLCSEVFAFIDPIPCPIFDFLAISTFSTLLKAGPVGTSALKAPYQNFWAGPSNPIFYCLTGTNLTFLSCQSEQSQGYFPWP